MSGDHALRARAELLGELHDIVQAMKNVAFAQLQRVSRELPTLEQARDEVLQALARLPAQDDAPSPPSHRPTAGAAWLVIGAERGFCGSFNARLAAEVALLRGSRPAPTVLVASRRLREFMGGEAEGITLLPGCHAVEDAAAALEAWLDALAPFIARPGGQVGLLHNTASGPLQSRLWPQAEAQPPGAAAADTRGIDLPLHQLPWPVLRHALQRQALRLLLQAALYESLAQENHWRLTQMQLAQDHLDELGRALRRKRSAARQAEITNELETLVSALPSRGTRPAKSLP